MQTADIPSTVTSLPYFRIPRDARGTHTAIECPQMSLIGDRLTDKWSRRLADASYLAPSDARKQSGRDGLRPRIE